MRQLSSSQQRALGAACEVLLPALDSNEDGPVGDLMRLGAEQRGTLVDVLAALPEAAPHVRAAVGELLEEAAVSGFAELALEERTRRLLELASELPRGRLAVKQLRLLVFGTLVASVDENDRNPVWDAIGYPGPASPPPTPEQAPKTLTVESLGNDGSTLECDVCVVGSGAGAR